MATHPIPFVAQPQVRPVLIQWSRWLAGGVTAIASSAILIAGFLAVADGVSHHFWLALLLLIGLFVMVLMMWLPTLLPQTPETSRR